MKKHPVVLKFGTGILAREGGCSLDPGQFRKLCGEIAKLVEQGIPVIVVSSAAVAAGIETMIAHGRKREQITGAIAGKDVGTRFPARKRRKQSRS